VLAVEVLATFSLSSVEAFELPVTVLQFSVILLPLSTRLELSVILLESASSALELSDPTSWVPATGLRLLVAELPSTVPELSVIVVELTVTTVELLVTAGELLVTAVELSVTAVELSVTVLQLSLTLLESVGKLLVALQVDFLVEGRLPLAAGIVSTSVFVSWTILPAISISLTIKSENLCFTIPTEVNKTCYTF